jgi:hypothetical protein
MFLNTPATFSKFQYTSQNNSEVQITFQEEDSLAFRDAGIYSSIITDFSVRTNLDYLFHHEHRLCFGANVIQRSFIPELSEFSSKGNDLDSLSVFTFNNFDHNEAVKTVYSLPILPSFSYSVKWYIFSIFMGKSFKNIVYLNY